MRALVTGGASGLGLALTKALLAQGDLVVVGDLAESRPESVPGDAAYLTLDVRSERDWEAARDWVDREWGRLDLLVNNAGVLHSGERFGSLSAANLDDSFRTNAAGPLLLTEALAITLADGGCVANVSSQLGSIANTTRFGTPSYNISKAAQNMATVLLAHALRDRGIRVVALHPGWVQTEMGGDGAQIAATASVAGLLKVIDDLTLDDSGRFLDWQGQPQPW